MCFGVMAFTIDESSIVLFAIFGIFGILIIIGLLYKISVHLAGIQHDINKISTRDLVDMQHDILDIAQHICPDRVRCG